MPRPMTVRQLVHKETRKLATVHSGIADPSVACVRGVNADDRAKARMIRELAPIAFTRTSDYLAFMEQNSFLNHL